MNRTSVGSGPSLFRFGRHAPPAYIKLSRRKRPPIEPNSIFAPARVRTFEHTIGKAIVRCVNHV